MTDGIRMSLQHIYIYYYNNNDDDIDSQVSFNPGFTFNTLAFGIYVVSLLLLRCTVYITFLVVRSSSIFILLYAYKSLSLSLSQFPPGLFSYSSVYNMASSSFIAYVQYFLLIQLVTFLEFEKASLVGDSSPCSFFANLYIALVTCLLSVVASSLLHLYIAPQPL